MNSEQVFIQAVAAELRGEMAAQGITHAAMADLTALSKTSVQRYLKGTREIPMTAFYAFAAALNVNPADVMAAAVKRLEKKADAGAEDAPASKRNSA